MNSVILLSQNKISEAAGDDKHLYEVRDSEVIAHIFHHLKKRQGDELKVTIIGQGLTRANILEINEQRLLLQILLTAFPLRFHSPTHTLIVGAIRPQSMKKVLEYGTCLGVRKFIFIEAQLSEKSFLSSKVFEKETILKHCLLGLSQSAYYSVLPEVEVCEKLDFSLLTGPRFLLSADAPQTFNSLSTSDTTAVTLAIGPERGFTNKEEEQFLSQSFQKMKIARSILRTELACLAALSQLELQQF